jgi:hypothetical protein
MEKKIFIHAIFLIICFFVITSVARAQKDDEVTTREIKSLDFQKQRPAEVAKAGVSGTLPPKTTPIQKKKLAVITGKNSLQKCFKGRAAWRNFLAFATN